MRLAEAFERVVGPEVPVGFRAYDGSTAGPPDAEVTLHLRTPVAVSHLVSAPNSLGLARAYVTGHLEVEGDLHTALSRLFDVRIGHITVAERLEMLRSFLGAKLLYRAAPPPQEARQRGLRHSRRRDQQAISHHYDVSNRFYELLLGPSMAYTCAVYPTAESTLEQAQFTKFDLVARKLGLREGMRLLDVGCGWGGMVMHAAREYGVRALGVTLSRAQAEWAQKAIADAGLGDLAEVRHLDYRDAPAEEFDAISSIGLTEHIGEHNLPSYFRSLYERLRPGGRLLNHCITRPDNRIPAKAGAFISRYVFPDGELVGVGRLVSLMHDTGFEVRHEENLREHYAMTLAGWCANLEENWEQAVREVGLATARVWRLYLAASRVGFERNVVQLHQVLGVKLAGHDSGMPLRPDWEPARQPTS
ncbi:SAM-dependent methyltransferase [Goodfellowiella coeruleoviolacea]|uniref:Cyclopropane-fatty-acyl-phospholipid synthase n=1 Tax=Goodfellowiella coeruleoviolacea TaxID=334858 RepID=A0AAE3GEK1_9PSEU|nr:cyclopropane-fatty-acyl-phospholipid synthase family protein [Goodfellowiella coeruleoviolacea]MCP2166705.1 cyclopropane-fatty-acyl-phospholipid synthase [Goodfellowiella coeruleoviolacea]